MRRNAEHAFRLRKLPRDFIQALVKFVFFNRIHWRAVPYKESGKDRKVQGGSSEQHVRVRGACAPPARRISVFVSNPDSLSFGVPRACNVLPSRFTNQVAGEACL